VLARSQYRGETVQIVEKCRWAPQTCVITSRGDEAIGPFVDTGVNFQTLEGRIYVSKAGFDKLAPLFGAPTHSEAEALRAEVARLEDLVAQLDNENLELSRFADSIDFIESRDFRARKKTGRPKKEPVDAAA
jgi:hypothetical protein